MAAGCADVGGGWMMRVQRQVRDGWCCRNRIALMPEDGESKEKEKGKGKSMVYGGVFQKDAKGKIWR